MNSLRQKFRLRYLARRGFFVPDDEVTPEFPEDVNQLLMARHRNVQEQRSENLFPRKVHRVGERLAPRRTRRY